MDGTLHPDNRRGKEARLRPLADAFRGTIEACRLEARELAGVQLGGAPQAVIPAKSRFGPNADVGAVQLQVGWPEVPVHHRRTFAVDVGGVAYPDSAVVRARTSGVWPGTDATGVKSGVWSLPTLMPE